MRADVPLDVTLCVRYHEPPRTTTASPHVLLISPLSIKGETGKDGLGVIYEENAVTSDSYPFRRVFSPRDMSATRKRKKLFPKCVTPARSPEAMNPCG